MMRAFSLAEAMEFTSAVCKSTGLDATTFADISTDTRALKPGDLFVALRGENFDGHEFLLAAKQSGASAVVVDAFDSALDSAIDNDPDNSRQMPQLVVADTVDALAGLAAGNRNESDAKLVAITGSSGKTTVKELTAAILTRMGDTLATRGNLNNHIGVPLTLFGLRPAHRYGVIELGASGLGEIAHTVAITRPQVAVLTNAGQAHLEGFGSYENIVQAKGEIIEGVAEGGLVVLNRDDPAFELWRTRAGSRRVASVSRYGHPDADYNAIVKQPQDQKPEIVVTGPGGWTCKLPLPLEGEHNVTNTLLAIAATRELGATDIAVIEGLAGVQPVRGRLQVVNFSGGLSVIDDSYNANPASMKAALSVLATRDGKRVAVFGAMGELGPTARELHKEVGVLASELGIDRLLTVGAGCDGYADGFGETTETYQTHEEAVQAIALVNELPMTVLVKGSRSAAMDLVVEGIKNKVNNACCSG
ncbi:UDP-N-acetylmuramoyl-tripeptide--D-alanyl-D-alanine ligase [Marinobacter sp. 2_MG-2023]|uniref:UDP-N-acetylmuramoyl-tripeptide--D-alanyl-D- alanine ligase n=1 Tax=Marinobacter sp. 2_MG-2023 TaxID=3062679 RepID=UPI0026E234BB|nr:UDP-N-acetylmuramoyl-tripeptide--D-alanyl-D-alanine ligase [Marinobacter sp. 2_MG-2023]MDO6441253.1 UDP-N-acetylmuramoyl-tripeptide--D-alanyl-D-alanine ligase [Marinobacter sp. 2_MG-2023]